jgi:hypothetical protein
VYYLDVNDVDEHIESSTSFLEDNVDLMHTYTRSYLSTRINDDAKEVGRGVGITIIVCVFNTVLMVVFLALLITINSKMDAHDDEIYKRILEVRQFTRDLQESTIHVTNDDDKITIDLERRDSNEETTLQSSEEGD